MPGHRPAPRLGLWLTFAAVHGWLAVLGVVVVPLEAFWDLDLYRWWAASALEAGRWPVLDEPWVYPVGALVPVLIPALVSTTSTAGYALGWCAMVTVLDAAAMTVLLRRQGAVAPSTRGAWWWLAFLVLLGPVAIGRLDAVIAPLMVVALALVARDGQRSAVAAALLTAGAWVKVAPGALLLPVAAARRPWRDVVGPGAAVTAAVVLAVAVGGGLPRVASFMTTQADRGLQAESVTATPWVLAALVREDVEIRLDEALVTYEVVGAGADTAADVLDPLLGAAVLLVGAALTVARRRGHAEAALLPAALTLVVVLVVVNKVGSPQLITWLAPPVAVLLTVGAAAGRAGGPVGSSVDGPVDGSAGGPVGGGVGGLVAGLPLLAAALTQVVFPWGYPALLAGDPATAGVLAARNAALLALLVCAVVALHRAVRSGAAAPSGGDQSRGATSRATRSRWSRSARSSTWR